MDTQLPITPLLKNIEETAGRLKAMGSDPMYSADRYHMFCELIDELSVIAETVPDLLEALEACEVTLKAFLPDAWATLQVVQSAIKKAKAI